MKNLETTTSPMEREQKRAPEQESAPTLEIIKDAQGRDYAEMAEQVVSADTNENKAKARQEQSQFLIDHIGLERQFADPNDERHNLIFKSETPQLPNFKSIREAGGYMFFYPDMKSQACADIAQVTEPFTEEVRKPYENNDPSWKEGLAKNKDTLLSEYKIHLQPKKEYIPAVIDRLNKLMADRPELTEIISAYKSKVGGSQFEKKRPDGTTYMDNMAEIVIYPYAGPETDANGKSLGRRNLEMALAAITEATADLQEYGNGRIPRENAKINELIYMAQSGGDLKKILKNEGMIDDFFDKDENGSYSFAKGEKPPTTEEIQAAGKALAKRGAEIKHEAEIERQQKEAGLLGDAQENILNIGRMIEASQKHRGPTEMPQNVPPLVPPKKKGAGAWFKGLFGK